LRYHNGGFEQIFVADTGNPAIPLDLHFVQLDYLVNR
jgi:hypothetical protein